MLNRRRFLKTVPGVIATTMAAPAIMRGQNLNSKLQVAAVGCDGKGWSDTKEMADHAKTAHVGFCDIDLQRMKRVRDLAPQVPVYQDYRLMFEELGDQIDAVTVSTPDHMHAIITLDAMQRGMHVYCQKPLTHNVSEARQVAEQAKKSGVITRLGNQIHSHAYYRTATNAIQQGVIGKIERVHSWCAATGHGKSGRISLPENPEPVPSNVDWDLWIGVAPMRPYVSGRVYHPWGWRDWQDVGNGAVGDFGCHILDPVYTALKIAQAPTKMTADHSGMNNQVWPAQTTVSYTFPGTEYTTGKTLPISWNDGGRLPSTRGSHLPPTEGLPRSGSLFIGEKGSLVLPHVGPHRIYMADGVAEPNVEELPSLNHYHGWVDGCLSGEQPTDGFDYGGPLTEAVLLGNIAVRYRGETLEWDAEKMTFTNHSEANRWLSREYREGWKVSPTA